MIATVNLAAIDPARPGQGYRVEVDGQDIANHVAALNLDMGTPPALPRFTLTVVGLPDVDLPAADVVLTAAQAAVLERLGWTPPPAVTP